MKVLHAVNYHRLTWGTDRAWDKTIQLSRDDGIDALVFARDSRALPAGLRGKARAFVGGIYAREAVREFRTTLETVRPDVVHTHELYPLISPWIIKTCAAAGVPVVQICYDYRLTCPIATHFVHGQICRRCTGGREWHAVLNNCRENLAESAAYGLRNAVARRFRLFTDHVSQFIVLTEFGRNWLMREVGIEAERITIQPCVIPMPPENPEPPEADYIAYAGRFAFEKGVHLLIEAARRTGLPLRLAGNAESHPDIRPGDDIACVATRSPAELAEFYRNARFLVVPSLWEETFSVVSAEAMSHGVPVLAARIGAIPDTVLDGVTGQFFAPGDVDDLAAGLRRLWDDPALCRRLGEAGRRRVATEFDEAAHLRQLRIAYDRAIAFATRPRSESLDSLTPTNAQFARQQSDASRD
jgi:glycosyltransferase involved in cell wall biosynthesis